MSVQFIDVDTLAGRARPLGAAAAFAPCRGLTVGEGQGCRDGGDRFCARLTPRQGCRGSSIMGDIWQDVRGLRRGVLPIGVYV